MSGRRHFGPLQSLPFFGFGVIKREGDSKKIYVHQSDVTFDFSGSAVSVSFLVNELRNGGIHASDVRLDVTGKGSGSSSVYLQASSTRGSGVYKLVKGPDGLNTVSGYCFRCCENGHEASDCDAPVGHGGGGCDPNADHSGCYGCGGNHRKRDCPLGYNGSYFRGKCYSCGEVGHMQIDCRYLGDFGFIKPPGNCLQLIVFQKHATFDFRKFIGVPVSVDFLFREDCFGDMNEVYDVRLSSGAAIENVILKESTSSSSGHRYFGTLKVDPVGDRGFIKTEGDDRGNNPGGGCTTCGKSGHETKDCRNKP